MQTRKIFSSVITGAMALSLLGVSYAAPNLANALEGECIETFHDLAAAVCLSSPEPILGLFGTWKNVPIEFDEDAFERSKVSHTIGFNVPGRVGHARMGIEADPLPYEGYSSAYSPFWEEAWLGGLTYQAIAPTRGDTPEADEVNNTYIMMRDDNESQWDLIYNFNHVGSTARMPEVQTKQAQASFNIGNPSLTTVGPIENRIQYMGGNMYWMRFPSSDVNLVMSNPACGDADANPRFCMDSELAMNSGTPGQLVSWNVGRSPGTASAVDDAPNSDSSDYSRFVNGVDQELLAGCLENSPDLCMTTVPGLADCVTLHEICNALPDYSHSATTTLTMGEEVISESVISESLRSRFDFDEKTMTYILLTVSDYEETYGASIPIFWESHDVLWVASTPDTVTTDKGSVYDGLRATLDASTGQLVYACAGETC